MFDNTVKRPRDRLMIAILVVNWLWLIYFFTESIMKHCDMDVRLKRTLATWWHCCKLYVILNCDIVFIVFYLHSGIVMFLYRVRLNYMVNKLLYTYIVDYMYKHWTVEWGSLGRRLWAFFLRIFVGFWLKTIERQPLKVFSFHTFCNSH